jgi:hypothetical protein
MSAILNRTMQLGRLAEFRKRLETLKIEIHSAVVAIVTHFEPLDLDLQYVKNIKPERLKVNCETIEKKMREFHRVEAEIKNLEEELGETSTR